MRFKVNYTILTEAKRPDSGFLGSTRSNLQNLTTYVDAFGPGQAEQMVMNQNGGQSRCVVHSAIPA